MHPILTCPYCKSTDIILPDKTATGWSADIDWDYEYFEVMKCMCYDCLKHFTARRYYTITAIEYEKDEDD